jgi:hypothetical protein
VGSTIFNETMTRSTLQTEIDFARKVTNEGIQRAVDTANRVSPGWSERAYNYLKVFVASRKPGEKFMTEEIRADFGTYNDEPVNYKAWGAVIRKGIVNGLIIKIGYDAVKNPKAHRTPAAVFVKNTDFKE